MNIFDIDALDKLDFTSNDSSTEVVTASIRQSLKNVIHQNRRSRDNSYFSVTATGGGNTSGITTIKTTVFTTATGGCISGGSATTIVTTATISITATGGCISGGSAIASNATVTAPIATTVTDATTINLPANSAGDIMLLFRINDTLLYNSSISGWTFQTGQNGFGTDYGCGLYTRESTGSETSVTIGSNASAIAVVAANRDFDAANSSISSGQNASIAAPSVTASTTNEILFCSWAIAQPASGSISSVDISKSGFTNLGSVTVNSFAKIAVLYKNLTSSGTTGSQNLTVSPRCFERGAISVVVKS